MKPILEVRNLWKQYKIGGQQASYLSLREKLLQPFQRQKMDTFWALQDINFDIFEGECVGIIGRNGAGKSTLLKILSQITPPTKGYIKARGRVASLLEVGTGFHPELTGRENVYLNGSILGLKRSEINSKFDEIIDFSGIEKFLDTPLKHYSSGMKLRLAFSVAAHLEPEILLIDEVLAVGDAAFQKKCLGKMDEVSKSGRTVLFVSHNLNAVRQLCSKGILLDIGKVIMTADINDVLNKYQALINNAPSQAIFNFDDIQKDGFLIHRILIKGNGEVKSEIELDESLSFEIEFSSDTAINEYSIGFVISSAYGNITSANNLFLTYQPHNKKIKSGKIICNLGKINFVPDTYFVSFWIGKNHQSQIILKEKIHFVITGNDIWGTGNLPPRVAPNWQSTSFYLEESSYIKMI
jgi:lipopolysaccharide transport system ATP-binding protein